MKRTALLPALLLAAMPLSVSASECPAPPEGMRYEQTGDRWTEASMNGAPFVKCVFLNDGNALGRGNYVIAYKCPSFSFVHEGIGATTVVDRLKDYHSDSYREKWYVVDKNENEWTIWESGFFRGWRSDSHEKGDGIKPVVDRTERRIANGCSHTTTTTATADGINLITRMHWTMKLVKKPVPTF